MNPKLLLCLALVLSGGLCFHLAAAEAPGENAPPAAKDAYVTAQLAQLFAGAPVHVTLRGALLSNTLAVDVSAPHAIGARTNGSATMPHCLLSVFDSESAARGEVKSALEFLNQPTASAKDGYDEFYSGNRGGMIEIIGRHGTAVVELYSSPSERLDPVFAERLESVFDAIDINLSIHPVLLSNLVHYAYTRHFGDPAPLRLLLSKLNNKIPELPASRFPAGPSYGENSVTVTFHQSNGHELRIIAKAYDSVEAAKEGQQFDARGVSVSADKSEIIQGVEIHEYARYGGIYFQVGVFTFRIESAEAMPFLLKVGSALIDEVIQGGRLNIRAEEDNLASKKAEEAKAYFKDYLAKCGTNEIRCLCFLQDNPNIGMVMAINLNEESVTTVRDVYDWAFQSLENRKLSRSQILNLETIVTNLPASDKNADYNKSVFVSIWNGKDVQVFQYDRQHVPGIVQRIYDIGGGYLN